MMTSDTIVSAPDGYWLLSSLDSTLSQTQSGGLPTSGMVWFSHDHTEADLPDDPEGRRVQFLVHLGYAFARMSNHNNKAAM